MKKAFLFLFIATGTLTMTSCKKKGCTDETAVNYNSKAKKDDGSCLYTPEITMTGAADTTISVSTSYTDPGATAINKDGSAVDVVVTNSVDTSAVGNYTVKYEATNANGTASKERTVRVAIRLDNYTQTWNVTHNCGTTTFPLSSSPTVTAGSAGNEVIFDNMFTLLGGTGNATVNGASITFPSQSIAVTGGDITFDGTGTMTSNGKIININYNYVNSIPLLGGSGQCVATYSRQ
ncbi:MAG: hypothetical protein RL264_887 [Bacteroidota bacterium]|jgi:hypothetical protein